MTACHYKLEESVLADWIWSCGLSMPTFIPDTVLLDELPACCASMSLSIVNKVMVFFKKHCKSLADSYFSHIKTLFHQTPSDLPKGQEENRNKKEKLTSVEFQSRHQIPFFVDRLGLFAFVFFFGLGQLCCFVL